MPSCCCLTCRRSREEGSSGGGAGKRNGGGESKGGTACGPTLGVCRHPHLLGLLSHEPPKVKVLCQGGALPAGGASRAAAAAGGASARGALQGAAGGALQGAAAGGGTLQAAVRCTAAASAAAGHLGQHVFKAWQLLSTAAIPLQSKECQVRARAHCKGSRARGRRQRRRRRQQLRSVSTRCSPQRLAFSFLARVTVRPPRSARARRDGTFATRPAAGDAAASPTDGCAGAMGPRIETSKTGGEVQSCRALARQQF